MAGSAGEQFQHWFEGARGCVRIGVLVMTSDGQIDSGNAEALEMLGCRHAGEIRTRLRSLLEENKETLNPHAEEATLRFQVPASDTLPARAIIGRFRPLGGLSGHRVLLLQDEAEIRGFEATLLDAARVQAFSRLQGTVRHGFNSPLQAVVWTFELLQRTALQPELSAEQRTQNQESIHQGRKELTQLHTAIRTFLGDVVSQLLEPELVDLRGLMQELDHVIAPEASFLDLAWQLDLPPGEVAVHGRRDQLKLALMTVILMAIESQPQGGSLRITVAARDSRAVFNLASGPSAGPDFGPEQFGLQFARNPSVTGIGWYVVRSIIESHNGEISFEPSPSGSRIQIRLPPASSATRSGDS